MSTESVQWLRFNVRASPVASTKNSPGLEFQAVFASRVWYTNSMTKVSLDDCWPYAGYVNNQGYGQLGGKKLLVHRLMYENLVGEIPAGLVIDHLCRVRHCINPLHMEAVTSAENTKRGKIVQDLINRTHCKRGHLLGTKKYKGWRVCFECNSFRARESYRRRKEATFV